MFTARARRALVAVGTVGLLTVPAAMATTSAASAADSNKLTVTAGEYTYKLSGKPKSGNVELVFDNQGVEYHMLGMVALKKGVTVKQVKQALLSDDENAGDELLAAGGGEVAPLPGFLGPDRSTTVIVNLKPGHYGMFCFFPAPDGSPHVAHGMVKTFDVSSAKSSFKPPTDGVTEVSLSDSAITIPSNGVPKSGWIKVTNDSSVARNLQLGEYLTADATFETADAYFDAFFNGEATGAPPASINGGVLSIPAGSSAYFEVDLSSGRYVLVSENAELEDDPAGIHVDFTIS